MRLCLLVERVYYTCVLSCMHVFFVFFLSLSPTVLLHTPTYSQQTLWGTYFRQCAFNNCACCFIRSKVTHLKDSFASLYYCRSLGLMKGNLTRQQIQLSALIRYFDFLQTRTQLLFINTEYMETTGITKKRGKSRGPEQ